MSNLIINCIYLHSEANLHTCLEGEIGRPVNYCNTYLLFVDIWCLAFKATTFAVKCWSPQSLIVTPFLYPAISFYCYRNYFVSVCRSVCLSVCHTGDLCLHDAVYWNMLWTTQQSDVSSWWPWVTLNSPVSVIWHFFTKDGSFRSQLHHIRWRWTYTVSVGFTRSARVSHNQPGSLSSFWQDMIYRGWCALSL